MSGHLHGGFWVQTLSGAAFNFDDPAPASIRLADITHALALLNRFSGHTTQPWSVAQHTLLCYHLLMADCPKASAEMRLAVLLHDAHEAYVGDVASPLKWAMRGQSDARSAYDAIESRAARAVETRFGLTMTEMMAYTVRRTDMQALWLEREKLLNPGKQDWGLNFPPQPPGNFQLCFRPRAWTAVRAKLHTLITNTARAAARAKA